MIILFLQTNYYFFFTLENKLGNSCTQVKIKQSRYFALKYKLILIGKMRFSYLCR